MPKDQPLRRDIQLLGRLLGRILIEQEGGELFQAVERVRALSKKARQGNREAFRRLNVFLKKLPSKKKRNLIRAFAHFLTLANIAEQHHRIRRRKEYQKSKIIQRGSMTDVLKKLLSQGVPKQKILKTLSKQKVELVFTAHPTEAGRRSLLQKHLQIEKELEARDRGEAVEENLLRLITACWQTSEIAKRRPTPEEEARWGLYIMENVLWDMVPQFLRELPLTDPRESPIAFGSWMGGDRDGNPFVTHQTTAKVLLLSRWMATHLYLKEIERLQTEFSMEGPFRDWIRPLKKKLNKNIQKIEKEEGLTQEEIRNPLTQCYRHLKKHKGERIARGRLLDLLRRLDTFGTSLFRLDIRQEAGRHTEVLEKRIRGYEQWDGEQRVTYLLDVLRTQSRQTKQPHRLRGRIQETLQTFKTIQNAPQGTLGSYIISMTRTPDDILAVYYLQKISGAKHYLPAVPLFETEQDLIQAPQTMTRLFQEPFYRKLIGKTQEVMLGYSDSSKDAGRLNAAWQLYQAQEKLIALAKHYKITLKFFRGRGGSIGRGGGPTYLAILSQAPGSTQGLFKATEQGEMIWANFGFPGIALRTLELYTTTTLKMTLDPPKSPQKEWRQLMDTLSTASAKYYRQTLAQKGFLDYFHQATPMDELSLLKIGSRPARRNRKKDFKNLRAIPWVFSWTQNRMMCPAWLGVGTALAQSIQHNHLSTLKHMYRKWPFFQSTMDLIEMVLAKADIGIATCYEKQLVEKKWHAIGNELRQEFARAKRAILQITGSKNLLDKNKVLQNSIRVRNPYVDPMNLLQMELLTQVRRRKKKGSHLEALLLTMNGIAAGMRNTG